MKSDLRAPIPYFGGKSRIADTVWERFGNVTNYVEPFCGSCAVLLARPEPFRGTETVNDINGWLCLAPDTRVLMGDLKWKRIGDILPGEAIIAFDEHNGPARLGFRAPQSYRRWRHGTVISSRRLLKPCYRLIFDDGTSVVSSADHQWLGGSHVHGGRGWRWQTTKGLTCNRKAQRSWLMKIIPVAEQGRDFDSGWIGGFSDGEAHIVGSPGWYVSIHQKEGAEIDRAEMILHERGFSVRRDIRKTTTGFGSPNKMVALNVIGGMREVLRFLMIFRPERLLRKALKHLESHSLYGRNHQAVGLVAKEFLGEREVVALETSTRTYIAEGLASHNCNLWRSIQFNPIETAKHASWPVSELDLHARGDAIFYRNDWYKARGYESVQSFIEWLRADPTHHDPLIAGWYMWGACCWIGTGWGPKTHLDQNNTMVNRQLPHLSTAGMGVNRQLPHLGNAGKGVNRQRPHLGDAGKGVNRQHRDQGKYILEYLSGISDRIRNVRVCCGEWHRVCGPTPTVKLGLTGVFLDPPYSVEDRENCYGQDDDFSVAKDVREWAIANGNNKDMRIALCGYEGEHVMPDDWECVEWKANGGYAARNKENKNKYRERVWFSPHCLGNKQRSLF